MGIGAPSFLGSRVGGEIATPIESCLAERRKQQELMRADRRRSYASHPVFGPLDPLQLKRCLSYAHMRHFPNGTTIFAKGVSGLRGHRCFFFENRPPRSVSWHRKRWSGDVPVQYQPVRPEEAFTRSPAHQSIVRLRRLLPLASE